MCSLQYTRFTGATVGEGGCGGWGEGGSETLTLALALTLIQTLTPTPTLARTLVSLTRVTRHTPRGRTSQPP